MRIILIPNAPRMTARHYCLAKALVANGHDVHYVMWELPYTLSPREMITHVFNAVRRKTYTYEEFTMHKFRRLPFFWPFINGWLFKIQMRGLYKKLAADIIFTESYTNETEVPKDLPYVYDLADDYAGPADVFGSKIYKLAFKLLDVRGVMRRQCENALAVTVVSKMLYTYASAHNDNVFRLPNGINGSVVRSALKTVDPVKNKYSVVYASGFGRWSRVIEAMQSITKLHEEYPQLRLTLVGDGTEVEKIKAYIQDTKADEYIHYIGFVSNQTKLFKVINAHAIGLNVSDKNSWRDASFPMKLIDYTSLGKKIVSTDLEEVKSLHFKNVFMFSNESDGLTKALRKALRSNASFETYSSLSDNILLTYEWSILTSQLITLFETSLTKRVSA